MGTAATTYEQMPISTTKLFGQQQLEQLGGFGHLLRGLREDVRPSLRRRVLQAISTVVDSDPTLAPHLLGLDHDHAQDSDAALRKKAAAGGGGGGGRSSNSNAKAKTKGKAKKKRGGKGERGGRKRSTPHTPAATLTSSLGTVVGEDDLLERITAILGYHGVAGGGGGGGSGDAEEEGAGGRDEGEGRARVRRVGRAFRALIQRLPVPRVRVRPPFSATVGSRVAGFAAATMETQQQQRHLERQGMGASEAAAAAATAAAAAAAAISGSGGRGGSPAAGPLTSAAAAREQEEAEQAAREGRDWWKDEVICYDLGGKGGWRLEREEKH